MAMQFAAAGGREEPVWLARGWAAALAAEDERVGQRILHAGLALGLLEERDEGDRVAFSHWLFQTYFCALWLAHGLGEAAADTRHGAAAGATTTGAVTGAAATGAGGTAGATGALTHPPKADTVTSKTAGMPHRAGIPRSFGPREKESLHGRSAARGDRRPR